MTEAYVVVFSVGVATLVIPMLYLTLRIANWR